MSLTTSPLSLVSTPALAAAFRIGNSRAFTLPMHSPPTSSRLVPLYQISGERAETEAAAAQRVVSALAERLRRLATAYGEWELFDAPAYFDLSEADAATLVHISERVRTVHICIWVDLLLPSFQRAASFWLDQHLPAQHQMNAGTAQSEFFLRTIQPAMVAHWQQLLTVVQMARAALINDIGYLGTNGAEEERDRWQRWWRAPQLPGLDHALLPQRQDLPTLTLSFDFPLPAHRQPDRLRRLWDSRERRRWRRRRSTRT